MLVQELNAVITSTKSAIEHLQLGLDILNVSYKVIN
jgi:uncharacterized coiled-coil protein SlyX